MEFPSHPASLSKMQEERRAISNLEKNESNAVSYCRQSEARHDASFVAVLAAGDDFFLSPGRRLPAKESKPEGWTALHRLVTNMVFEFLQMPK